VAQARRILNLPVAAFAKPARRKPGLRAQTHEKQASD
jgi:hypothetical protein